MDFFRKLLGQNLLNYYHLVMAIVANFVYGFPSRKLHVIGVTGTDGKTTTVNMISSILRAAGHKTAHLSTVNAQIGDKFYDTGLHTTTPSSFLLQKFLSQAVASGAQYFVLEVTSHALDQSRTFGIRFETSVLTNVSHEHLDYHKDLEHYRRAKAKLFHGAQNVVLNADDPSFDFFKSASSGRLVSYSLNGPAEISAGDIVETLTATKFTAHAESAQYKVSLELPGAFNVANALAGIAVGVIYKLKAEAIAAGLSSVAGIPGRMEYVGENVIVDFAHTPNAIFNLLKFLRPKISGRIIHVFGAAGERDRGKREAMGKASGQFADITIITREDNRSEQVEQISEQIAKGLSGKQKNKDYFIIPGRREAIREALRHARGNTDFVVITGKGHEQSLNIDGKEVPWDDREVAREEIMSFKPDAITH